MATGSDPGVLGQSCPPGQVELWGWGGLHSECDPSSGQLCAGCPGAGGLRMPRDLDKVVGSSCSLTRGSNQDPVFSFSFSLSLSKSSQGKS